MVHDVEAAAPALDAVPAPTRKGTLRLALEVDLRRMTRKEAGDGEPVPYLNEYTPEEIARLLVYALDGEEAQAEMFAGSGLYAKITKVRLEAAAWNSASVGNGAPIAPRRHPTVAEAEQAVSELTGDAAKVARLLAACLNAEAAFHMLGCRAPKRRTGFLPVGVQTLVEIEDVLASMPAEAALVKASMAFACDFCGMPAESGTDDGWICDACCRRGGDDDGGEAVQSEPQPDQRP